VLHEARRADFMTLADVLGLTAGNLSRNLTALEERGYVRIEKTFEGRRPRTWVQATPAGMAALDREVAALRALLGRLAGPPAQAPRPLDRPEADLAIVAAESWRHARRRDAPRGKTAPGGGRMRPGPRRRPNAAHRRRTSARCQLRTVAGSRPLTASRR
jgi:DNA-binding PadR family transcriptional regulator